MGFATGENMREERASSSPIPGPLEESPCFCSSTPSLAFKAECIAPLRRATAPVTGKEWQSSAASVSPTSLNWPVESISPTALNPTPCQDAQKDPIEDSGASSALAAIPPVIKAWEPSTAPRKDGRGGSEPPPPSPDPLCLPEPAKPSSLPLESTSRLDHSGRNVFQLGFYRDPGAGLANRKFDTSSKKSLNVDSPSFTPAQLPGGKKSTFSTNATPFTPRGAASCKFNCLVHLRD